MILLSIPLLICWCSICEWLLHRYLMHRSILSFEYAYVAHTKVHHNIFKYDESYRLQKEEDKKTIPMAWWNGCIISLLAGLPLLIFGYKIALLGFVVSYCYYGVYEFIHWCMHLPKRRGVEYRWWFRKLNAHHLLHHRYMNKNFNVVLPLADWLFGTLLLRSPVKFMQCNSDYCLPDVQPK